MITLTAFTFAERTLGFLFKIYLSHEVGAVGMGIFSVAQSFFFVLLTLLTSGIPLVISKQTAKDRGAGAAVCSAALIIELAVALFICLAVVVLQKPIGSLFADGQSMTLVLVMLPALVFSGVYSAFRGVLWGEKKFVAVSAVELIEQIARIVCCIALISVFKDKLRAVALSVSVACAISAAVCAAIYFFGKRKLLSPRGRFKPLLSTSIPITASRTTSSINNYIIAIAIPFLLMSSGFNSEQAMYVFGSCVGMALPLLYLPITVVGSLAFVMIPTLSQAYAERDVKSMRSQIESALSFSVIIAAVIFPAYSALGEPLGRFLYNNTDAGLFLKKSAWLLLPLSFENIASSMLNSLDLERKSLYNYLIGALVMYAVCFAFYSRFDMDVFMTAFGVSLIASSVLDVIDIKRRTGIKLTFFKPMLICLAACYPAHMFASYIFSIINNPVLGMAIGAIGGVAFCSLAAVVFGAVDFDINIARRTRSPKPERVRKSDAKNDGRKAESIPTPPERKKPKRNDRLEKKRKRECASKPKTEK